MPAPKVAGSDACQRRAGRKPVENAFSSGWRRAVLAFALSFALLAGAGPAFAQAQGQLFATQDDGYGRLILSFPGRDHLPEYTMRIENGILSLEFGEPVSVILPDVGVTMPDYLSIARVDPDGMGLRLGLKRSFNFNRIEAGEKLFVDLLPQSWQGMPPPLPQDVIDELARRAKDAAIRAERERKAAGVEQFNPRADIRIGRNPTFLRIQFDWTVPTVAEFRQEGNLGVLGFEWPVDIDLRNLALDLPAEVTSVSTDTTPDGATVTLELAEGVTPRFYEVGPNRHVLDIDIAGEALPAFEVSQLVETVEATTAGAATEAAIPVDALYPAVSPQTVQPFVSVLGSTVRVVFPFEQDTPAAVFRRGDTVWMLFDTTTGIVQPTQSGELDSIANAFSVVPAGDTQVVRIDLAQDRLATLGSEGMAWVLSLGDILLTPTQPVEMSRRRDIEGNFEITADLSRPARAHDFRDPVVGDVLKVVTAFPPARGITRVFDYVEFSALRSVHGLVLKPQTPEIGVAVDGSLAVISTPGGLTVSASEGPRVNAGGSGEVSRTGFVDLKRLATPTPAEFNARLEELQAAAATAEGTRRDAARLELAQLYLAHELSYEAIGVLEAMEEGLQSDALTRKLRTSRAIANTLAGRPRDALAILNTTSMGQDIDALVWRTIARVEALDYKGARLDAIEAQDVLAEYPDWARNHFYFAAVRAGVETNDPAMAERFLDLITFAGLNKADMTRYQLLSGRVDELRGRPQEALDTYGQVIAADVRPTRAEAVYRTLRLLQDADRLDLDRATQTLAAESMLWRGNQLEAEMQKMLAEFYFRGGDYRSGFETVQQAVANYPDSPPVTALRDEAQRVFGQLFLDGLADSIGPVEALALFYDFSALTPPGARGDEMIRNLARRLVRMDLLQQASELLQYQLDNRLRGIARSQVAADLAVVYLANRRPQDALRVLNDTRLANMPDTLVRQRRVLEARALIDAGRDELALDMLRDMEGPDVVQLRIDANWRARRYAVAGSMIEAIYSADLGRGPLSPAARLGIVKAAVGYSLSGDALGLSRLRSKFGDAMVTTPEWPMFDLVSLNPEVTSLEFKQVARQVADVEGIEAFLAAYRSTYGEDGALAPLSAAEATEKVASAGTSNAS